MFAPPISIRQVTTFRTISPKYLPSRKYHFSKKFLHDASLIQDVKPAIELPPMARLPTRLLLRSFVLTSLMTSKIFLNPALFLLKTMSSSDSAILNADRNPILNKLLRWTVYNHFCAGTNHREVSRTVAELKKIGYQGIILGYSREVVLDLNEKVTHDESGVTVYSNKSYEAVDKWKKGTLDTLHMVGAGDFLAVK